MNRTELAQAIALKTEDISRAEVLEVLTAMQEVVTDTLRDGETVVITGFVKFAKQDVPAKKARKGRLAVSRESSKRNQPAAVLRGFANGGLPAATSEALSASKSASRK